MKYQDRSLGQIFRAERKKQSLSVPQLAAMTGLPLNTIYNFERGDTSSPTFRTVAILTHALQLSLDELTANIAFKE